MLVNEMLSAFYVKVSQAKTRSVDENEVPSALLSEVANKYDLERKFDKIAEANYKIDEIKIQVQEDLKKVAVDQKEMEELDKKAENMATNAKEFEKDAKVMETHVPVSYTHLTLPTICSV
eukprot:TRINITY_DN9512_c0_g1_i12.p3 TRINITY_DN9512_c0_g1~~TRINITY_DN9512_c0_g1_i12.p3  ORF type:complete len:120 (+),score=48.14 TRINITY_DN9512_c0_g1_i12:237-596(+)